jgi:DNA processing protein
VSCVYISGREFDYSDMNDRDRLLILNMVEGIGSVRTRALLEHFGSTGRLFRAGADEIANVEKIGSTLASNLTESLRKIKINRELELIARHKIRVMTFMDRDYPENLKNIYDPPVVLYVRGKILPCDDIAVAVVGSRRASFYGMRTAEKIGFELASRGITVVSGLARGIDSSAHKGALKAGGRTLAVLGSGLSNIYPGEHVELAEKISRSGAVISEFPMETIPDRGNFPKRNRVISGLSMGVVVVEAAEKSGALITSDSAIEQGREVFAVPGKIDSATSKGTNMLIKQGAKLAGTIEDILEELDIGTENKGPRPSNNTPTILDKEETLVYNLLTGDPRHIDELSEESDMEVSGISRVLFNLEMRSLAKQLPGKNFVRS